MTHLCPGKRSTGAKALYGYCHRCDRLHEDGRMQPALVLVAGVPECSNWVRLRMVQSQRMSVRTQ